MEIPEKSTDKMDKVRFDIDNLQQEDYFIPSECILRRDLYYD